MRTMFGRFHIMVNAPGDALNRFDIVTHIVGERLGRLYIVIDVFGEFLGPFDVAINITDDIFGHFYNSFGRWRKKLMCSNRSIISFWFATTSFTT
jgi:hypothetical protein